MDNKVLVIGGIAIVGLLLLSKKKGSGTITDVTTGNTVKTTTNTDGSTTHTTTAADVGLQGATIVVSGFGTFKADIGGLYVIKNIPPGIYTITFSMPAYQTVVVTGYQIYNGTPGIETNYWLNEESMTPV